LERLFFLVEFLENEINATNSLLSLAHEEKDAVIKNDVKRLSALVEKQQAALAALNKLEAERVDRLSRFYAEAGMPAGSRLRDAVETAGGALRERLKGLVKELESAAAKLRRAGTLNRMLIDTQLQYTSFCMNLLMGGGDSLNTYSGSGRLNERITASPRLVDQGI
jgi:flagellar biosynthesis/type III secretory pathway chaperone